MDFIRKKIALKVAILVNAFLLIIMAAGTWFLIIQQNKGLEEQLIERGKIESIVGAKMMSQVFEEAIDNGVFSVQDAFDREYTPIPGFDPPKYHTKYDSYLDKAILALEDEFLIDESVIFAVAVDINGYLPTHNTRYNQPPTGDKEKDLLLNRTKRIFDDETGIAAAKNTQKGFKQKYKRDTGEVMYDFSSPIYVKGKHWGGFRIGFSLDKINEAKTKQSISLIIVMAIIFIISHVLIMLTVNTSIKPLRTLIQRASDLADGQKLDEPITTKSIDETGQLADVLERLRFSIVTAMKRLRKK
ncbi:putative methyl-accepting chemotaxis sensory transducer [Desulfamplus magnetovallimortis]|uniref:Putative methyl-accepting chemotaxis sensory transducer n=1 Tax=Desulfamplus magnetovallimortis TaxID=1246637 RepID=A0A1W1H6L2_9BACT|nr:HAMP domain-containing protein [Desulfamplus magnetovallimortis]SLM28121.1 putative methyl-accepting chemotaxis sensory transducer [Desulfamplus magnetovallimortis]